MGNLTDEQLVQDLEYRIHSYEQLETLKHWPGALGIVDYLALLVPVPILIVSLYLWGQI